MIPLVAYSPAPGPAAATPLAGPEVAPPGAIAATAPPLLGAAAVTAATPGRMIRHDPGPGPHAPPTDPPADPAPLKGLGIPPLNTRQVGDFDKLDDTPPPPPPGGGYSPTPEAEVPPRVDLRR